MSYRLFRCTDGLRLDVISNDKSIRDIIELLLIELDICGYITTIRYKLSDNEFVEYDYEPPYTDDLELLIKVRMEFSCCNFRTYFEHELKKRDESISKLELCLAL